MNELTFERAEGDRLICVDDSGAEYAVPITEALKSAVVRPAERTGMADVVIQIPEVLRPKDIQALVRSGADPAELADASGLDLDHINRYAAPVIDEREFVSQQARTLAPRHDPEARSLEELARRRLAEQGIDLAVATWDAVRQAQGWVVRLDFETESGPVRARWQVDLPGRSLSPLNEQAQWIVRSDQPDLPVPLLRHLSAVPGPDGDELDSSGAPLALLDGLMDHRGLRQPVSFGDEARPATSPGDVLELRHDPQSYDWDDPGPADEPTDLPPPLSEWRTTSIPAPKDDSGDWLADSSPTDAWNRTGPTDTQGSLFEQAPVLSEPYTEPQAESFTEPGRKSEEEEPEPERPTGRHSRSQTKRSSVPSWDEIVFGSSRSDQ